MISFRNDYSEVAHPRIIEKLLECATQQNDGYGLDLHSRNAADSIRRWLGVDADIHFIPGGTQTNLLAISACLRPFECVISCDTGHVNVHETGAIEGTGHKVVTVPHMSGKLTPDGIRSAVEYHADEHMVKPRMVYLSNSTELGTIYTKAELTEIRKVCDELGLLLFLDGARLGSALTSVFNDLTLSDLAELCDLFYIGGTKNGAMFGEALVIVNPLLKPDFRYMIKNRGAMLAKGFVTGMQFEVLFEGEEPLYFALAEHANHRMRDGAIDQSNGLHVLLGVVGTLADSLRNFSSLAHAATDTALLVADDHQGGESHVATALNSLGNAVDCDQFLFVLANLVIALHSVHFLLLLEV
jgi:threonine aldolase